MRGYHLVKRNVRKAKRSGSQECPTCGVEVPLVEHHIYGREVKRWREPWNVVWICPTCHDRIHLYDIIIEGWFNIDGVKTLVWRKAGEEPKICNGAKPPRYEK